MAYQFKLEQLLGYRRTLEEQSQHRLTKELGILENHRNHLEELTAARVHLIEDFDKRKQKGIMAAVYLFYMGAIRFKEQQIATQGNTIAAQEKVVEDARRILIEKRKDREIVEKVKEKDYQLYLKEEMKKELHENDEQVLLRFGRIDGLI